MPTPTYKVDPRLQMHATARQREILDAIDTHGGQRPAARALGLNYGTVRDAYRQVQKNAEVRAAHDVPPRIPDQELVIPTPPDASEPIEDLIERKRRQYSREVASDAFHRLIDIGVRNPGPVVIAAVGDPHVDDDKCDIGRLVDDMTIIGRTQGMYALHVGDITNNWVGRLGRLYAHQSTKASDGIRLAEHMFRLAPPLAVIGGNHDLWNEGMSWLNFCVKQGGIDTRLVQAHGVRLNLVFPGGRSVRVHARHDFPGHSQFNAVHGLAKEHLFGQRDHINIAGHKHIDSLAATPSPEGFVHWMFRVSGYKAHDDYAKAGHFQEKKMSPTVALMIDPSAKHGAELVKPYWDLEEAADVLKWKRSRVA